MEASSSSRPPSGPGSSRASYAAGNPFLSDAGPEFDAEQAQQQPAATPLEVLDVAWQSDRVRTILRAQGVLTHDAIGVGQEDWLWRESELEALAEPLANTLNKIPVTRAAAAVSDELTAGAVLLNYARRSISERARVIRAAKAAEQEPPQRPAGAPVDAHAFDLGQPPTPAAPPDPAEWKVPE